MKVHPTDSQVPTVIGNISRWGTKGYGFVQSDELEGEAWLHVKFLDDPEYQPRQGDRVEFQAEKLPDGRYQARRVRQVGAPVRAPRPEPPRNGYSYAEGTGTGGFAVKLSLPASIVASARPALPAPHSSSIEDGRAVEKTPPRAQDKLAPHHADSPGEASESGAFGHAAPPTTSSTIANPPAAASAAEPHAATDPLAAIGPLSTTGPLAERLTTVRRAREESIARLRKDAQDKRDAIFALQQSLATVEAELDHAERGGPGVETALVGAYVTEAVSLLSRGLDERRRLKDALDTARRHAIARSGLPPVLEYEALRERLREAREKRDNLTEKAFRSLERDSRAGLRDYADAFDRFESAPPLTARFIAFGSGGQTMLVAPVRSAVVATSARDDIPGRIALAFWHAGERAAREWRRSDGSAESPAENLPETIETIEHGQVAGAVAVRTTAFDGDALQILFEETWASREILEQSGIEPAFETVSESIAHLGPVWEADAADTADESVERAAAGGAPSGTFLPEVARRIGLSAHDLVALLHDRGLPFNDDSVDAGVEETLRRLLGEGFAEHDEPQAKTAQPDAAVIAEGGAGKDGDDEDAHPPGPLGASGVASRMLKKLLRDRRVGGRHTRIEHAYGHHFSDEEKDLARRVAEWLEKEGIFIPKLNEGAHHISINPRRLREVGQIIDGTWDRRASLDAIV